MNLLALRYLRFLHTKLQSTVFKCMTLHLKLNTSSKTTNGYIIGFLSITANIEALKPHSLPPRNHQHIILNANTISLASTTLLRVLVKEQ